MSPIVFNITSDLFRSHERGSKNKLEAWNSTFRVQERCYIRVYIYSCLLRINGKSFLHCKTFEFQIMTGQIIIKGAVLIRVALRDHPAIVVIRVNL